MHQDIFHLGALVGHDARWPDEGASAGNRQTHNRAAQANHASQDENALGIELAALEEV